MRFGEHFYKLSGSGNDFVAFDAMAVESPSLPDPARVQALCRRGTGVGADGVVVLCRAAGADYRLVYYNRDGSRAELCGNASLCSVRLAVELGHVRPDAVRFLTDSGLLTGRMRDGLPEIPVLCQRGPDQGLQLLIAQQLPPGQVCDRRRVRGPLGYAKGFGLCCLRALVVRSQRASG